MAERPAEGGDVLQQILDELKGLRQDVAAVLGGASESSPDDGRVELRGD